jgi:Fe-S-cluster containining protein
MDKLIVADFYKHNKIDCGNCPVGNFCCTLKVRLSFWDRVRIFFMTGRRTTQYADRLFDNSGWGIKLDGDCHFLERPKNGKAFCRIYKARPTICRKFPHFYEDVNDCRDIVKKWKKVHIGGTESTEIHFNKTPDIVMKK